MTHLGVIFIVSSAFFASVMDCKKTYRDMFPHKHKFPIPIPFPIPGWDPDTNPWDETLYPPLQSGGLLHGRGPPPKVRLTSDSPAMNGSCITFTAALEHKCQKEDPDGNLVYDEHCDDANGQVRSGYVYNWTSWLDDYGFGKCTDLKRCNVFPDGKPFPQSNDWRRKGYVYVWHTMGQYFETCDGSSSSLTVNTTNMVFGAGVMEVMVYRKRERRKYSPMAADNTVFFVTDKIPLAVNISQKEAENITDNNAFVKDSDIVFKVQVHDPSNYLKTAAAVDYIWDFRDGNQLVTHSNVATHAYSTPGDVTVKLIVEAAFRVPCPPPTPTPMHFTQPQTTAPITSAPPPTTTPAAAMTTASPTTEPLPTDALWTTGMTESPAPEVRSIPVETAAPPMVRHKDLGDYECFRYMYGNFEDKIKIVEPLQVGLSEPASRKIVGVSAAKLTNSTVNFLVTCLGRIPTSACTIVSDVTCRQVMSIMCDDVPPSASGCQVSLKRSFQEPGTYCVNITLQDTSSLALATTSVTIGNGPNKAPKSHTPEVVLSSSAVLIAVFACIALIVYKRYKVYRPVRRSILEDAESDVGGMRRFSQVKAALFPSNEERSHLLAPRP